MVKNPPASAGDAGLIPGLGRSPVEGNGNPLQYSLLGNPTDRSLAGHSPWGRKESDTTEQLNNNSLLLPWKNNWTGFKETLCVFVYNSRIMESKGFRSRKTLPCNPLFLRGVH